MRVLGHLRLNVPAHSDACMAVYRMVSHWKETELAGLPTGKIRRGNRDLRISYLTGDLTEDKFKETLQRRFKEREKRSSTEKSSRPTSPSVRI
jgi:hypothetical protein